MKQAGAFLTTSESMIFELLGHAKAAEFKDCQKLVLSELPDSGLVPNEKQ
jgi:hypothetical protein